MILALFEKISKPDLKGKRNSTEPKDRIKRIMRPHYLMPVEKIQELLENCSNYEIIKTLHAKLKLHHEQIPEEEIDENLKNPKKLVQAVIERKDKYILYFKLSNSIGHKYVIGAQVCYRNQPF